MKKISYIFVVFLTLSACLNQNKKSINLDDYKRAEKFVRKNLEKKIYNLYIMPNWLDDSTGFWYVHNTREGKLFTKIDYSELEKKPAFDQEKLAASLSAILQKTIRSDSLPFDHFKYIDEYKKIEFPIGDSTWIADLDSYNLELKKKDEGKLPVNRISPDKKWYAFSKDYDLFVRKVNENKEIRLSQNGEKYFEYASYYEWDDIMVGENSDRPERFFVKWSPDSKKILTQIVDLRKAEKLYLYKIPADTSFRANILSYYRALPGDTNYIEYLPVIFTIEKRKMTRIDLDPIPHFLDIDLNWTKNGNKIIGTLDYRGYKQRDAIEVDPETGKIRIVISDKNDTYIENQLSKFVHLEKTDQALMTSERNGWNHIYLFDWETGELVNQVTSGEFVVTDIIYTDEEKQVIFFTAVGKETGENPYYSKLYKVNFNGSGLELLTTEKGNHQIYISNSKDYLIDNYSKLDQPAKSVLRNLFTGEIIMELETVDIDDVLAMGWTYPEEFSLTLEDGITKIYGALWKPTNFNRHNKYPIIDHCYTGPQASIVPKSFPRGLFSNCQSIAELGFIIIMVDGRGTAMRSKAFHDFSYKNLGAGVTDHVYAIRELSRKYSFMDTTRIGIYGRSAGGYDAAHALLLYPDFYKVAVSISGNHDHRMAKAWWPEMYMGYPAGNWYHEQSNITMAKNLKGKLLLVHGGIDANVNPASTLKLTDALIKENKEFDLLIIPNSRHGFQEQYDDYLTVKRWNYFIEHLMGVKPILDFKLY